MTAPAGPPRAVAVAAATLATLPGMTPARLHAVLSMWPDPRDALSQVQAGRAGRAIRTFERGGADPDDRAAAFARAWTAADAAAVERLLRRRAVHVFVAGYPGYPIDDALPHRPPVLLGEGERPDVLDRPRVAIVGTRAATPHGIADATELGRALAGAGVTVVSGLALGIDGAAHQGAIASGGGVIGVVATGLDVVYPRRHGALFDDVRRHGLLLSENAYGTRPHPARFPVRNRIIAALADVVVVVEATTKGGARITVEHALEYGRPVLAMPGSRRNPAAAGCNELLRDGALALLEPGDVLVALGLTPGSRRDPAPVPLPGFEPAGRAESGPERAVLRALGGEPASPDQLAARVDLDVTTLSGVVDAMTRRGLLARDRGLLWPR